MWDKEGPPQRFSQRLAHSPFNQSFIDRTVTVHCGVQLTPASDCLPDRQQRYLLLLPHGASVYTIKPSPLSPLVCFVLTTN
jgi:hypothetical protein